MPNGHSMHDADIFPCISGSDGMRIPHMGIGTYELRGETCRHAVLAALRIGFRLIDTAAVYRNEEIVGAAIRESGIPRSELFVVVKLAPKSMKDEACVEQGIRESIDKLGIVYADGVLIHWPGCGGLRPDEAEGHQRARRRCWEVMSRLQDEGLIRYLGVSNFAPRHFSDLSTSTECSVFDKANSHRPVINQIELHPLCVQESVCQFCTSNGIVLQQYSPLGKGDARLIEHPKLRAFVQRVFPGRSVHDVLLMWGLQKGFCVLVRSGSEEHLAKNWRAGKDFFASGVLSQEQREQLDHLREWMQVNTDEHICWHSENIE